ncbi:putative Lipopolysaccharide biosynthesis protein [Nostocoides japonicum T1-X7]|uniref:Putative Lipopolysaccharide biosynthesis protein n=1 Tax=Nostocoides japonicum T1-X7 TaxID=1194083 RepID=A0A077M582_9MICO|nr:Wzz/FepE/Etk N-terminal domain-containing protein [Tetrasphaera japonica]CCH79225.1 putative Lipopolysaccharide biosynthesis protein [Tetrasphaera japonica T1-X7]
METAMYEGTHEHLIVHALRRRAVLIITIAMLVAGCGAAYTLMRSPSYTSSTAVLLNPAPGNPLAPGPTSAQQVTIAMQTEASMVTSPAVTKLVDENLHTGVVAGTSSVTVTVPSNTQIVAILAQAASPADAKRIAASFADQFLAYRAAQSKTNQANQLANLNDQLKSARSSLAKAAQSASKSDASADASAQVQIYTSRVAALQDSIGQIQATQVDAGSVVKPATLPSSPDGLPGWLLILASAALGLFTGLAVAVWRERADDKIRVSHEVLVAGFPVLGDLGKDLASQDSEAAASEAYRLVRTAFLAAAPRPSVIVVSPTADRAGPASGPLVAGLGRSLVDAGYRAVLVDTVPEAQNSAADVLGVPDGPGLFEVLTGMSLDAALVDVGGLKVLRAGNSHERSRDLLGGRGLTDVFDQLHRDVDFVIVAAPPSTTSDGNALVYAADACVLIVMDQVTTYDQVVTAASRARQLDVPVLGLVCAPRTGWGGRPAQADRDVPSESLQSSVPGPRHSRHSAPNKLTGGQVFEKSRDPATRTLT